MFIFSIEKSFAKSDSANKLNKINDIKIIKCFFIVVSINFKVRAEANTSAPIELLYSSGASGSPGSGTTPNHNWRLFIPYNCALHSS